MAKPSAAVRLSLEFDSPSERDKLPTRQSGLCRLRPCCGQVRLLRVAREVSVMVALLEGE